MSKNILIAGGTGMIGKELSKELENQGYQVLILTRNKKRVDNQTFFYWNPTDGIIEIDQNKVDHIINLAGAGIADALWTEKRKKEILSSRIDSTNLLVEHFKGSSQLKTYVGASAIGFYGNRGVELMSENNRPQAGSFLSEVCVKWEEAHKQFEEISDRIVITRIGIVLSKEGGAFPKMILPTKFGLSSYLGAGDQIYSWIHIDDMVHILSKTIQDDKMQGIYNATAPNPVTNKELTKSIKEKFSRFSFLAPAPKFILKTILGEMSNTVLDSVNASAQKVLSAGYEFKFETIDMAANDLLKVT